MDDLPLEQQITLTRKRIATIQALMDRLTKDQEDMVTKNTELVNQLAVLRPVDSQKVSNVYTVKR
jgi:hypothetical protein